MPKKPKPKRKTLAEKLQEHHDYGYEAGHADGYSAAKKVFNAPDEVEKLKRLQLVEQTVRSFGQAVDALAHALMYVVKGS